VTLFPEKKPSESIIEQIVKLLRRPVLAPQPALAY
jgi:hypothetical protein